MPSGPVAALNIAFDSLSPAIVSREGVPVVPAPEVGWTSVVGADGTALFLKAIGDGTLVWVFAVADSADAFAVRLRAALGAALDMHEDARGVALCALDALPDRGGYADVVAAAAEWAPIVAADDPRLTSTTGWSFAAAFQAFQNPEVAARVAAQAASDAIEEGEKKLDEKLHERRSKEALRRSLAAALGGKDPAKDDDSPPSTEDLDKTPAAVLDQLEQGLMPGSRRGSALEASLKTTIESELGEDGASKTEATAASEGEKEAS